MNFLQRIWRIIRANINGLLQKTEDPEKILEQAVSDMQEDLVKLRQAVAQANGRQTKPEALLNNGKNGRNLPLKKATKTLPEKP